MVFKCRMKYNICGLVVMTAIGDFFLGSFVCIVGIVTFDTCPLRWQVEVLLLYTIFGITSRLYVSFMAIDRGAVNRN